MWKKENHYTKRKLEKATFLLSSPCSCKCVLSFRRINFFTLAQMLPDNAFRILTLLLLAYAKSTVILSFKNIIPTVQTRRILHPVVYFILSLLYRVLQNQLNRSSLYFQLLLYTTRAVLLCSEANTYSKTFLQEEYNIMIIGINLMPVRLRHMVIHC